MKTVVYTELTPELKEQWEALWKSLPAQATAFNSPQWLAAAVKAFRHKDIRIVAIYDNESLVAVASLVSYRLYGVRIYAAPALEFADKPTLLVEWHNRHAVSGLVQALKKQGIVYITECSREQAHILAQHDGQNPVVFQDDINSKVTFENGPYGDLAGQALHKINKRIAKAQEEVSTHYYENNHIEHLKEVYEVEENSTKGARGMTVFHRDEVRQFFEEIGAENPDLMRIISVHMGKRPIAFSVDFLTNGVYQGSQKAYVKGYEYYQPGKYMVMKLLEYYMNKGFPYFDLGRGYDGFKQMFTKKAQPLYTIIFTKNKTAGSYIALVRNVRMKVYESFIQQPAVYRTFKSIKNMLP